MYRAIVRAQPHLVRRFVTACVILAAIAGILWTVAHIARTRVQPAVTLLPTGEVLLVGGSGSCLSLGGFVDVFCSPTPLNTAERYDPATDRHIPAARLHTPRSGAALVTLSSGQVLAIGGIDRLTEEASPIVLASTERYDPASDRWTAVASMIEPRSRPVATLLRDGRVLVTGDLHPTAAVYDPRGDQWTPTGPLRDGRARAPAVLLPSGQVLVVGGDTTRDYHAATAECYDPASNQWHPVADLHTGRTQHTATLLPDGQVLVVGGQGQDGVLASSERYDPTTDRWELGPEMHTVRFGHSATALPDGRVLVVGGGGGGTVPVLRSVEMYDGGTGQWRALPATRNGWTGQTAVALPSGVLYLTGGDYAQQTPEVYDARS